MAVRTPTSGTAASLCSILSLRPLACKRSPGSLEQGIQQQNFDGILPKWLRGKIANLMRYACAGSNPADIGYDFFFLNLQLFSEQQIQHKFFGH